METETKQIIKELKSIKSEIDYIKENMVSADMVLNKKEKSLLNKARDEYRKGKTISLADLEKKHTSKK